MAAKEHSHDHHDHSNCNHDHGSHTNATQEQLEKVNARQQEADKLTKSLLELNALATEYKKKLSSVKPSPVVVAKADVDLLVNEMGITKAEAESALKNNEGDVVTALNALIAQ